MVTDKQKTMVILGMAFAVCASYLWSWAIINLASRDIMITTLIAGAIASQMLKEVYAVGVNLVKRYRKAK